VQSIFRKLASSLRLPDLIGKGMPERIRSVGFAFLGLTAAAGLALVALFAQMGFPLLTPAPLPSSPEPGAVSKAVRLESSAAAVGLAPAQDAAAGSNASGRRSGSVAADGGKSDTRVGDSADLVSAPTPGDSPDPSAPVVTAPPAPSPAPSPAPVPVEAPATTTESTPAAEVPVSTPDPDSKPDKSTAVDPNPAKPEAKPAATKPSKPVKTKPAKAKPSKPEAKPETAPAPEASYVPAPEPAPTETGKGKGKGTEEKDKKSK
jgi:hypothetical protein